MLKNCSACKQKHVGPFGSRCRATMAVIAGYSRDDPEYLSLLEADYSRRKMEEEKSIKQDPTDKGAVGGVIPPMDVSQDLSAINHSLRMITDRLSQLEKPSDPDDQQRMAAANLLSDPLTKALAKLSGEETEEGRLLRPETYAQSDIKEKNRDYTKMDVFDLFHGWIAIADHLLTTGGDIKSYVRHVKFATEMLHTQRFYVMGATRYDRLIIDRFASGKSKDFTPDTVLSLLSFSANVIPDSVELCLGASLSKGVVSYLPSWQLQSRRRRNNPGVRKAEEVPADFPSDVWFFYRQCTEENCNKAHVCRKCRYKHRADMCKEKTRKS